MRLKRAANYVIKQFCIIYYNFECFYFNFILLFNKTHCIGLRFLIMVGILYILHLNIYGVKLVIMSYVIIHYIITY